MVVPQIPGSHDKTLDLRSWLGVIKEQTWYVALLLHVLGCLLVPRWHQLLSTFGCVIVCVCACVRACVRPPVRPSVRPSVCPGVLDMRTDVFVTF